MKLFPRIRILHAVCFGEGFDVLAKEVYYVVLTLLVCVWLLVNEAHLTYRTLMNRLSLSLLF